MINKEKEIKETKELVQKIEKMLENKNICVIFSVLINLVMNFIDNFGERKTTNERTRMFINALERCIAACLEPVEN